VSPDNEPSSEGVSLGLETFPWASGVVAGVVTFLVGYLAFFAVVLVGARSITGPLAGVARVVGFFFYNAHFIPTERRARLVIESNGSDATREITQQATNNTLLNASTALPVWVYLLVPALVVVAAGALFARVHFEGPTSPQALVRRALGSGAALTLGYLLVALVGTFVLAERVSQGEAFRERQPERLRTLLFGAVYPFVLVSLGAGIGQALDGIRDDSGVSLSETSTAEDTERGHSSVDAGEEEADGDEETTDET